LDVINDKLQNLSFNKSQIRDNGTAEQFKAIDDAAKPLVVRLHELFKLMRRLDENRSVSALGEQAERQGKLGQIRQVGNLDSLTAQLDQARKSEQKMATFLDALAVQRSFAIDDKNQPDIQAITQVIDKREREFRKVREQILQLEKREGELLRQGIEQGSDLPGKEDFGKLDKEADKFRDKFALDIETDPAKRSIAQIGQEFERQMDQIREKFDGVQETELLALAARAQQAKIDKVLADEQDRQDRADSKQARADAKRDTNAGFAQRGTSEAFSAILKATGTTNSENQFLAAIAKATAESAKANKITATENKKKNQPKPGGEVTVGVVKDLK